MTGRRNVQVSVRFRPRRRLDLSLVLLAALTTLAVSTPSGAGVKAGAGARRDGDRAAAVNDFQGAPAVEAEAAAAGLAETYLVTGRYAEAIEAGKKAAQTPAQKSEGLRLTAEGYRQTGK